MVNVCGPPLGGLVGLQVHWETIFVYFFHYLIEGGRIQTD